MILDLYLGNLVVCCCGNYKILTEKGFLYTEAIDKRSKIIFLTNKGKEIADLIIKIEELLNETRK